MLKTYLIAKLHSFEVTGARLDYEGSVSIDSELLEAAGIEANEQVHIWNVSNGQRIITYAIEAHRGTGEICINGAGAHLFKKGDKVIIAAFGQMSPNDYADSRGVTKILIHKHNDFPANRHWIVRWDK